MDHITVPKIALYHIATVEKLPSTSLGCPLIFRCKNFQVAHFVLDSDLVCHEVYISLLKLSQPALPEDIYAFSYNPKSSKEMRENGWKLIDPISDFERMGIPNRYWTITDANRSYEAAICRCSQPLSGFYTRCVDDKLLLEAISQTNPGSQFMYVIDTRPKLNATANRAAGKGYENEDSYANIRFRFMGIENIHVMWSSLQKLLEVCELKTPTMSEFLRGLESSGWLRHIKALWMLEFSLQRCGHLDGDSKEVSPIFTQFLDCIWQLMEQFPCAFEFNENFLLEIHDHVFSCQFGNFLGNCQKDREDLSPFEVLVWCFDKGLQPKQSMIESLLEIKKQRAMLEADVHVLEKKLNTCDEPPEEVCTCSQLGNLLSQHLGNPLTNPLGFMGIDGDLNTLMENGTLSREGGLRGRMDQVNSQCADLHCDCCEIMDSVRAINMSGDVSISEAMGISADLGIFEAMGISEVTDISRNMGISEARGFSGDMGFSGGMGIIEDTGISEDIGTKEAGCSKQQ